MNYYKDNVSTNVVTSNCNYVVTVKDWPAFLNEYNNFSNTTLAAYNAAYLQLGGGGNVAPGVSFLLKFGAFLNLYKADPSSDEYMPLKLNQNNA
ncbi:hypothetical protein [Pedobacter sp. Leaf176]|uniref:hypothetical protein n=1 Tax=Pedobacter sp. Leaf176 TaxID=1736286 RepID=UPI0006FA17C3|nr:hypothetical protein [Pedobacter sp. Leaf176]KQR67741.1 hypothetical protein ASF92_18900 [Pedobacter sp. Leaf176]